MKIDFRVARQTMKRTDERTVVSDSKNYLYAEFAFSDDWDGISKIAQFTRDNITYNKDITSGSCLVPWEVLKDNGRFYVNVFGGDLITVNECVVAVKQSGLREGQLPDEPTPGYFDSVVNTVKGYRDEVEADRAEVAANAETVHNNTEIVSGLVIGFDNHITEKISDFDENATSKTNDFNMNATLKTEAINTKASEAAESASAAKTSEDNAKDSETEATRQAGIALNNILNGVSTHDADDASHPFILSDIRRVETIARGRATAFTFPSIVEIQAWFDGTYEYPDGRTPADLVIGDNIYDETVGVPDYWWNGTQLIPLGAETPDLSAYYTKTEVDNRLPETIEQTDYDALVAAGTVIAGRIYYVVPDGELT